MFSPNYNATSSAGLQRITASSRLTYAAFFLMTVSVLTPRFALGSLSIGLDDLLVLPIIGVLLINWASRRWQAPQSELTFVAPAFGVFVTIFFFVSLISQVEHGLPLRLPTELWQYVKRAAGFLIGFQFVCKSTDNFDYAVGVFSFIFLFAMAIGVLPLISDGVISDYLANIYARTDHQLERLINRESTTARTFGVAGFSTAWGGFSAFAALFALSRLFTRGKSESLVLPALLLFLALFNIFSSASRGALAALLVAFAAMGLIFLFDHRVTFARRFVVVALPVCVALSFILAYPDRAEFLAYRIETLIIQKGGARIDQIGAGLELLNSVPSWLFGVSNAVQRELAVSHGIESEPIYLLINYGIVGVAILSTVVLYLLRLAFRLCRQSGQRNQLAGYVLLSTTLMYLVFSLGYFFLQEIVVGITFWVFAGCAAGLAFSQRRSLRRFI